MSGHRVLHACNPPFVPSSLLVLYFTSTLLSPTHTRAQIDMQLTFQPSFSLLLMRGGVPACSAWLAVLVGHAFAEGDLADASQLP